MVGRRSSFYKSSTKTLFRQTTITINRSHRRNAINPPTAQKLTAAFLDFEADASQKVYAFHGGTGHLMSVQGHNIGPMGPSCMTMTNPVIVAIVGPGRALDMILSDKSYRKPVGATEASGMELANRVVPPPTEVEEAMGDAGRMANFPLACLNANRGNSIMRVKGARRLMESDGRYGRFEVCPDELVYSFV
ncbi:hypothetical protein BDW66DRAFT_157377 [Aspergillus desertorum]